MNNSTESLLTREMVVRVNKAKRLSFKVVSDLENMIVKAVGYINNHYKVLLVFCKYNEVTYNQICLLHTFFFYL